jgi:hypothetical protein
MTGGLDTFLSIVIPAGIIIFLAVKIYNKMTENHPNWAQGIKDWLHDKTAPTSTKLDPMKQGSIQYYP